MTDYIAEELQTIESDIEVLALNLREKSGQEKAQIYLVMDLTGSRIRSKWLNNKKYVLSQLRSDRSLLSVKESDLIRQEDNEVFWNDFIFEELRVEQILDSY